MPEPGVPGRPLSGPAHPDWQLPAGFLPGAGRPPLSYHHNPDRWPDGPEGWCRLRSAARGQEFVLDLDAYPAVVDWLASPGLLG